MAAWHYTFRIGFSADGRTLHPSEAEPAEGVRFPDLDQAKDEAEQCAGRALRWVHNPDVGSWTAVVGDGRVAVITPGAIVGIRLAVRLD